MPSEADFRHPSQQARNYRIETGPSGPWKIPALLAEPSGRNSATFLLTLSEMKSPVQRQPRSCILAIEPDSTRATTLARFLRRYVHADVEVVKSTEDAVRSIAERIPDLVLTSVFLAPADEATLTARLKQLPAAAYLQVITIPHFIDFDETSRDDSSKILNFLKRRSALVRPTCDPRTVRDQIEHYLERARVDRINHTERLRFEACPTPAPLRQAPPTQTPPTRRLTADDVYTLANGIGPRTYKLGRVHAKDRRRTPRRSREELASPLTVKLPWDAQVRLINISRQGVLLESASKVTPGRTLDLRLLGKAAPLSVAARIIRSEVAQVAPHGVKYWIAAAFDRDLDIQSMELGAAETRITATAAALADLLASVLGEGERTSRSDVPCARFEEGLRRLLPVRDVQLRTTPVIPDRQHDSIYFNVPTSSSSAILQVIFEPDQQPSAVEFRLLKAAASMAAVVLELTPSIGHGHQASR